MSSWLSNNLSSWGLIWDSSGQVKDAWNSSSCSPAAAAAKSLQSCPTLCDPIDGSPPASAIPGILQARTLEWVAISFSIAWKWKVKVKSLSRVRLVATPWTAAYQAPPSLGFSRQDYWSGVPVPSPSPSKHVFCCTLLTLGGACVWSIERGTHVQTKSCVLIYGSEVTSYSLWQKTLSGDYSPLLTSRGTKRLLREWPETDKARGPNSPFSVKLSSLFDYFITSWELEILTQSLRS